MKYGYPWAGKQVDSLKPTDYSWNLMNNLFGKFKNKQSPSWGKVGEMQTVLIQKAELPFRGGLTFLL